VTEKTRIQEFIAANIKTPVNGRPAFFISSRLHNRKF